jgi:Subtilase family
MTMQGHRSRTGLLAVLAGCCLLAWPGGALADAHLRGLSNDRLTTRDTCASQPVGYARCAARHLLFRSNGAPVRFRPGAASSASTPAGLGPSDLLGAYSLTSLAARNGAQETVAIVDAYDDPNAEADLAAYRAHYGLPACTRLGGCFRKVNQTGGEEYPAPPGPKEDWTVEISLDLDMVSAICPHCKLLLVEAQSNSLENLATAAQTAAATPGVVAVSNSYTANEGALFPWLTASERAELEAAYAHAGVAFTAASGDAGGEEVNFPAVLATVSAVGGTTLTHQAGGWSQTAWAGTGSGCSQYVSKPTWQQSLGGEDAGCAARTNNDVAADADPNTGAATYDTYNGNGGWNVYGGTSESSPIVAAFYALIGQEAGVQGAGWDYAHTGYFTDVSGGATVAGCESYLCEAISGYDGPTGLGTPTGGEAEREAEREAELEAEREAELEAEREAEREAELEGGGATGAPQPPPGSGGSTEPLTPTPGSGSVGQSGSSSSSSAALTTTSAPAASATRPAGPAVSHLALTRRARAALNRRLPLLSRVRLAFTLSARARVTVTLAKRVRVHGRWRWKIVSRRFSVLESRGRRALSLRGRGRLSRGLYRVTVTPAGGRRRSLTFHVAKRS